MNNKKKVAIVATVFIIALGTLGVIFLTKGKDSTTNENIPSESGRVQISNVSKLDTLVPDNVTLADSDWFDDANAPLIFVDGSHWVWYDTSEMNSNFASSGTYELYYGENAYKALDAKYFETDEDRPEGYEGAIVLKLTALSIKDNGEEKLSEPSNLTFMGSLGPDIMSLVNMDNPDSLNLTAEPKVDKPKAEIKKEEVIKDVVYGDNLDAWKSLEIKAAGNLVSYPYSASMLEKAGLTYKESEVDPDCGYVVLYPESGNGFATGTFSNRVTDELSSLSLQRYSGVDIILPNGITWGSGEEEVLSAYGEPSEIIRGSVNEKIYRYNLEEKGVQLELAIFTEDCLYGTASGVEIISINGYINEG